MKRRPVSHPQIVVKKSRPVPQPERQPAPERPGKLIKPKQPPIPPVPEADLFRQARLVLTQAGMLTVRNGVDFVEGVPGAASSMDIMWAANRLLKSEGKRMLGKNHHRWTEGC